jgi:hypothetical protein
LDKRPATGRWRTNKKQRVDAEQTRTAARTQPGQAARDVTGAEHLARHLPNPGAERPFFLLKRGPCAQGSAHRVMLLQFTFQIVQGSQLVTLRRADVFMSGHVLHLPQVMAP